MKLLDIISENVDNEKEMEKIRKIYRALRKGKVDISYDSSAYGVTFVFDYEYELSDDFKTQTDALGNIYVEPKSFKIYGGQIPLTLSMIQEPLIKKFASFGVKFLGTNKVTYTEHGVRSSHIKKEE